MHFTGQQCVHVPSVPPDKYKNLSFSNSQKPQFGKILQRERAGLLPLFTTRLSELNVRYIHQATFLVTLPALRYKSEEGNKLNKEKMLEHTLKLEDRMGQNQQTYEFNSSEHKLPFLNKRKTTKL